MKTEQVRMLAQSVSFAKIVAVVVYIAELFVLLFAQDWLFSKEREFEGIYMPLGAFLLVYFSYTAIEAAHCMIYHWMQKTTSITKVLLSPLKIASGYYLFWRVYVWIKS